MELMEKKMEEGIAERMDERGGREERWKRCFKKERRI